MAATALNTADARVVRSGGSSGDSGQCDNYNRFFGTGVGVFEEGTSTGASFVFEPLDEGAFIPLPDGSYRNDVFYTFALGEQFEFFAVREGTAFDFLQVGQDGELEPASGLDALIEWEIGGFTFTSDTLNPTFDIPDSLFLPDTYNLLLSLTVTFTPSEGNAFFDCADSDCTTRGARRDNLTPIVFGGERAAVFFEGTGPISEIPLPAGALLMLTGLGGAVGIRGATKR
ncbi:VPLPA-CTERM sorting domain-containing protein [Parvularcula mediterranea]|uniref:VPLPA-CTERM sorting domain-containing protein n=1 Tax=Parvularcula mediterranea TaxID=2732508 RepID=UPI001563391A|nr:VPLPA-CTERM sorting domain-containing protein [Parvularcula mediterranea]